MSFYLYLNQVWHAEAWTNGGLIPISPASTYKSLEREGIYTPDENLIHESSFDLLSLREYIRLDNVKNFSLGGANLDGWIIPEIKNASLYEDDGLILSFSTRLTKILARNMKKRACVKIIDIDRLQRVISDQLGVSAIVGFCEYTSSHERNHFLKSELDEWQAEYRMFWPLKEKVEVNLPVGVGQLVCTWDEWPKP